ncbi:NAD kinase [Rhodococcus sp. NPDC003318]|uniref:NAD kinase n=1 Tax=Rhodococcus sp. NPDC003318 TaxID=3364503 RepID=UPI0036B582D7
MNGEPVTQREILVVAHTGRPEIAETVRRIARVFAEAGIGLRVLASEADHADVVLGADVQCTYVGPGPAAAHGCELVLVLGGDGTFLRGAESARAADIPVLGINLGRIGFLAETEAEHLEEALGHLVRQDYRVEHRMTIDIAIRVDDVIVDRGWALNEASIENVSRLGVLEVVLEVDGRPVSSFGCDGVLVSTPTGSTAYAFSAGGPVVWPELEALLVIPSNAHALFARPLVTSPESLIAIETFAGGHDGLVFCDGSRTLALPAGGRVEVVRGANPVKWIRLDSAPFADRMVRKFALPVQGWRGPKNRGEGDSRRAR